MKIQILWRFFGDVFHKAHQLSSSVVVGLASKTLLFSKVVNPKIVGQVFF